MTHRLRTCPEKRATSGQLQGTSRALFRHNTRVFKKKAEQTYAANNGSRVYLRGASMGGRASLVLRGANPVFQAGCYFTIDKNGDKLQYVDFEVPEGGWSDAPIRTSPNNTTAFGYWSDLSEAGRRILLRVPTNCPAALAGETLDVPLVRWPKGVYTNAVELSTNNLPHPSTDYFYTVLTE